jgi:hypothetical protein
MRRFLLWFTARLPVKLIGRDGDFAEWYHLATVLGLFRVQLHRFLRSDPDGLHDHPWGWAFTLILHGWYVEERRDRDRIRSRGYFIGGDTFHRVVLPHGCEVWTLFVHGPYVKHWGFIKPVSMKAVAGGLRELSWHDREGSIWEYEARARDANRFDDWPWAKDAPRGRDIRKEIAV